MSEERRRVMQSIFALSDEIEYNIYDAQDIAEYARMEADTVSGMIRDLYDEGYLGECMSIGDDGYETFYLNKKGRILIGVEE
jgi:DNA-binding MarR family transcriptional regulator